MEFAKPIIVTNRKFFSTCCSIGTVLTVLTTSIFHPFAIQTSKKNAIHYLDFACLTTARLFKSQSSKTPVSANNNSFDSGSLGPRKRSRNRKDDAGGNNESDQGKYIKLQYI